MNTRNLISGLLMAILLLTVGCMEAADDGPQLVSLEPTPTTISLAKGRSTTMGAMGTYDDGTTKAVEVEWISDDANVASVLGVANAAGTGIVTAMDTGTATLTAMAIEDPTVSEDLEVTVTQAVVESLVVSPDPATVPLGMTVQFSVTGTFSDATTGPVAVTWTTQDASIATIAVNGLATGQLGGSTTITASVTDSPAITASAALEVLSAIPVSLSISPDPASVPLGLTVTFTSEVLLSDGTTTALAVNWTTSDATTATVDASGIATGEALGTATITATAQSDATLTDTAALTVTSPVLTAITVSPAQATVGMTGTHTFSAQGTLSDGTFQAVPVTWTTVSTAVATIDASGTATGVASGTTSVTAKSQSDPLILDTAAITVTTPFTNFYMNNVGTTVGNSIDYVPYGGGTASTLISGLSNITGLHVSKDKKSVYLMSRFGTLSKVDIATGAMTTEGSRSYGNGWQALSMDANGDLYTQEINGSTIQKFDTTNKTFSTFCGVGTIKTIWDTCPMGTEIWVCYLGGIAKASSGGTLATVQTTMTGSKWCTSIDKDASNNLYVMDFWPTYVNNNMIYTLWKNTDQNNDGDFGDFFQKPDGTWTPESTIYAQFTNIFIGEIKVDPTGVIYGAEITSSNPSRGIYKIEDLNGDGDALDANEVSHWSTTTFNCASGGGNLSFE